MAYDADAPGPSKFERLIDLVANTDPADYAQMTYGLGHRGPCCAAGHAVRGGLIELNLDDPHPLSRQVVRQLDLPRETAWLLFGGAAGVNELLGDPVDEPVTPARWVRAARLYQAEQLA